MARNHTTTTTPALIDDERFSSNGMVPSAPLMQHLAGAFNFVACRAKKLVLCRAQDLVPCDTGSSLVVRVWPTWFRTGENTTGLRVLAGMAPTDLVAAFSLATEYHMYIRDSADVNVVDKAWKYLGTSVGSDVAPGEIHHIYDQIDGLTPNTDYLFVNELLYGARLAYLTVVELESTYADSTVAGVCSPGQLLPEHPIYDSHIGDLVDANNRLWKHNGAQLISHTTDYRDTNGPTVTSATYINPMDGVSTTVTASSSGWKLYTQYHNTTNRTTVPVKMAVKVLRTVGAGTCDLKFTDGTNSITITGMDGTTTSGWATTTGTLPPQAGTKWDVHMKVTSGTFIFQSLSLYEFET